MDEKFSFPELRPLLQVLYQEAQDAFSLFDSDFKHLAFLVSNYQMEGKGFSLIINNYAFYVSDKGEKKIIEKHLKNLKEIVISANIKSTKILDFNEIKSKVFKTLDSLEESIKNDLVLCSELLDSIPQKLLNNSIHSRKSFDDEMEILSQIKKQYIRSAYNYFQEWFDFSHHADFKAFSLKKVFHVLFQSTMVYIDYSLNTKFTRNKTNQRLEHILLPYSSMLNPKNLSFISHEINFFLFRNFKKYLKNPIKDSIDAIYKSIASLVHQLDFISDDKTQIDNFVTKIVDKLLIDFITLYTAGPNYAITLFNLLSKRFVQKPFISNNYPEFLRAFFITKIARELIQRQLITHKENGNNDDDGDIANIYLKYIDKMDLFLECSIHQKDNENCDFQQLVSIYKTISNKMIKLVFNELLDKENKCLISMPWIISNSLFRQKISIKDFLKSLFNFDEEKINSRLPDSFFLYMPDILEPSQQGTIHSTSAQCAIKNYGSILAPEILCSIELSTYLNDSCEHNYHFPQLRISRLLSCSFRIALISLFYPLLTRREGKLAHNINFFPINKPSLWVFVNINWKNLYRNFSSNQTNTNIESFLTKFEKEYKDLVKQVNDNISSTGQQFDKKGIQSNLSSLYYTLGENDYFFALNDTLTRYHTEKWPIWKKGKSFNDSINDSYYAYNTDKAIPYYMYSSIVAERFFSNTDSLVDNKKLKTIVIGSFKRKWNFGNIKFDNDFSKNLEIFLKTLSGQGIDKKMKEALEQFDNFFKNTNCELSRLKNSLKEKVNHTNIMKEPKDDIKEIIKELTKYKQNIGNNEYNGQVFRLIDQVRLLMLKSQNQPSSLSIEIINTLEEIQTLLKELLSFNNVVMLLNLIDFLHNVKQKKFEVYLTNTWSDIGLVIHEFEDKDLNTLDKLYREFFYYSQTHLLSDSAVLNKEETEIGHEQRFNVLLQTSTNCCDDRLKTCLKDFQEKGPNNTIGFFDYHITIKKKSLFESLKTIRNVASKLINEEDACDVKDMMSSIHIIGNDDEEVK